MSTHILLLILIMIVIVYTIFQNKIENYSNPCTDYLTDDQFLEHMIPHHQVAVDMCHRLLLHTKNSHMMALCYDIVREQQNEILQMNQMLQSWDTWQQHSNLI